MKINLILAITLGCVCYLVIPFTILCVRNKKAQRILSIICLFLFDIILLVGVWGKIDITANEVQISFDFAGKWCAKNIDWTISKISTFDLVINLVMLIPIGIFVCFWSKDKPIQARILLLIASGFLSGTLIELSQFILPITRSVQLTDVLLNTASVLIGGIICMIFILIISKIQKQKENND